MATTVNGKLLKPLGTYPVSGLVTITLVDYDDEPVIGFNTTDDTEIISTATVTPAGSGAWTASLVPNSQIQLTNGDAATVYRVVESTPDGSYRYYVLVGVSSPVWVGDIRAELGEGAMTYLGATFSVMMSLTGDTIGSYPIYYAPQAYTITAVRGIRVGGTGATINAQNNGSDIATVDLSLTSAGTWMAAPALQNVGLSAGASLSLEVASASGTPTSVTVQVDMRL